MARPGKHRHPPVEGHEPDAFGDHPPEIGRRRLHAEADEAERRDHQDHEAHVEGHLGEQAGHAVGQNLLEQDVQVRCAGDLGGLNVAFVAKRAREVVDQPGVPRPPHHGDRQHDVEERGLEIAHDGHGEDEGRQCQEHVRRAHDHGVDEPAVVAREQAEDHAHWHRDREHQKPDRERDAIGVEDPREDVAPVVVGAEEIEPARRLLGVAEIDEDADMLGEGCDQRCNDRHQRDHQNCDETSNRKPAAAELVPGARVDQPPHATRLPSRICGLM